MPATAIIGYPPGTMGPEETGAQTAELYAAGLAPLQGAHRGDAAERSAGAAAGRPGGRARRVAGHGRGLGLRRRRDRGELRQLHPGRGPGLVRGRVPARRRGHAARAAGPDQRRPSRRATSRAASTTRRRSSRAQAGGRGPRRPHLHGRHHARPADHRPGARRRARSSRRTCSRTSTARCWRPGAITDVPIEWGIPFTGVHPMDDPLPQPVILAGRPDGAVAGGAGLRAPGRRRLGAQPAARRPGWHPRRPREPAASAAGGWRTPSPGGTLRHPGGRTIDEAEHVWLAWVTHNVERRPRQRGRRAASGLGRAAGAGRADGRDRRSAWPNRRRRNRRMRGALSRTAGRSSALGRRSWPATRSTQSPGSRPSRRDPATVGRSRPPHDRGTQPAQRGSRSHPGRPLGTRSGRTEQPIVDIDCPPGVWSPGPTSGRARRWVVGPLPGQV